MKELKGLSNKGKKIVGFFIILSVLCVFALASLTGCSPESVDKAKDMSDKFIDVIDKIDEVEKDIEELIGDEAPCESDVKAEEVSTIVVKPIVPVCPGDRASRPIIPPTTNVGCVQGNILPVPITERIVTPIGVVQGDVSPIPITEPIIIPTVQAYYCPDTRGTVQEYPFENTSSSPQVLYQNCNGGWPVGDSELSSGGSGWGASLEAIPDWSGVCDWYQG